MTYEGPERRSRTVWSVLYSVWLNVVPLLALCLAGWTVLGLSSEAAERRNQNCRVFEGQHLADVQRLTATYRYLETLPKSEYGKSLTLAVLRGLKAQEAEARSDAAPPYCDEPGVEAERRGEKPVGLPEPDPPLPRMRDFSDRAIPQK